MVAIEVFGPVDYQRGGPVQGRSGHQEGQGCNGKLRSLQFISADGTNGTGRAMGSSDLPGMCQHAV